MESFSIILQNVPAEANLEEENMSNLIPPPSTDEEFFEFFLFLVFFLISCESDAKSYGCDMFACALVSSVTVSALHSRTLPQGP